MHAIEVTETGGPEVLKYVDKPRPSPRPGEVLIIKAEAIGVNFVDTYFRSGSYPHKRPFVLGAEVGGTVEALGDGVTALRVGNRVATADAVGAYTEYCVAPANVVASLPDGVSPDVAAAAILRGMTAHLLILVKNLALVVIVGLPSCNALRTRRFPTSRCRLCPGSGQETWCRCCFLSATSH